MNLFLPVLCGCFLLLILLSGVFMRSCLLIATVRLTSMSPTLVHGDRVLALRHLPGSWLHKGQIVLIWPRPGIDLPVPASYQELPYIKRIVAVSGETFALPAEEPLPPLLAPDHPGSWHIPPGHVFVRGDNHESGVDSTVWGPVPLPNILAVVLMKLPGKAESARVPAISPGEAVRK